MRTELFQKLILGFQFTGTFFFIRENFERETILGLRRHYRGLLTITTAEQLQNKTAICSYTQEQRWIGELRHFSTEDLHRISWNSWVGTQLLLAERELNSRYKNPKWELRLKEEEVERQWNLCIYTHRVLKRNSVVKTIRQMTRWYSGKFHTISQVHHEFSQYYLGCQAGFTQALLNFPSEHSM